MFYYTFLRLTVVISNKITTTRRYVIVFLIIVACVQNHFVGKPWGARVGGLRIATSFSARHFSFYSWIKSCTDRLKDFIEGFNFDLIINFYLIIKLKFYTITEISPHFEQKMKLAAAPMPFFLNLVNKTLPKNMNSRPDSRRTPGLPVKKTTWGTIHVCLVYKSDAWRAIRGVSAKKTLRGRRLVWKKGRETVFLS